MHGRMPGLVAQFPAGFTDRFLERLAPHLQQHGIRKGEAVFEVEHVDQVRRVRQHGFVEAALALGFLFAQVAFGEQGQQVGEVADPPQQLGVWGAPGRMEEGERAQHLAARRMQRERPARADAVGLGHREIGTHQGLGAQVLDDDDAASMGGAPARRACRIDRQHPQRRGQRRRYPAGRRQAQVARRLVRQVDRGPAFLVDEQARLVEQALQDDVIGGAAHRIRQDVFHAVEVQACLLGRHGRPVGDFWGLDCSSAPPPGTSPARR